MRRLIGLILLGGCARYAPLPLADNPAVLSAPIAAVLAADGTKLDRPYLRPEAIDLRAPLTPNALAVLAVLENPDLKAQRTRAGVSDAQAFAARLLPDPTLTLGYDYRYAGPDPYNGLLAQLGYDLNQFRERRVVQAGARAARAQVRLDLAWAEWQAAGAARLQGARILALTQELALDRESAAVTARLLDVSLRAAGRGDLSGDQVEARRTAALDSADRLRTSERDLAAARFELNRIVGLPPGTVLRLAPIGPTPAPPDAAALFAFARAQRFDLKALQAGYKVQEAAVHRAVLDQFPTLTRSFNAARDTANNRTIGPSIAFTPPLFNRNRGGIAVSRSTRAQLGAEYAARLAQTRSDIAAAVGVVSAARRQSAELTAALPALTRFAAANRRAAARGDLAEATAEVAEQTLRDRQRARIGLDQAAAEGMIALELSTGTPRESWPL